MESALPFADAFAQLGDADGLTEVLSRNFSYVLYAEFSAKALPYRDFVHHLGNGGWQEMFDRYPVLARLIRRTVELRTEENREFRRRLEADLPALQSTFGRGLDRVAHVSGGLSDPHRGQRSVKIVEFASGARVVYKPKPLALDLAWNHLLDWVNTRAALHLKQHRVHDRGAYGWTEFIPPAAAGGPEAVHRFYRRAGALLAMLYLVRASDCHFENLIACGEHPVLIDTETLVQPDLRANGTPAHSVLRSGLLPSRDTARGEVVRSGGLDDASLGSTATRPSWSNINSNRMSYGERNPIEFSNTNVPLLDGRPVQPEAYAEDVVAGFRETYRLLHAHSRELLRPDGPLTNFRNCEARFLLRNTRVYGLLLRCTLLPEFLGSEDVYRARILTLLKRLGDRHDAAVNAEAAALDSLDVPLFTVRADSTSLFDGPNEIPDAMTAPAWDGVQQLVRNLGEDDLARQVSDIRSSFRAAAGFWEEEPWSAAEFIQAARRLADRVARFAEPEEPDCLYDGPCGAAFFLAALFHVTGDPRYAHDSLAVLEPTRRALAEGALECNNIGAGEGSGSIVYALARIGSWLGDATVTADAVLASRAIDSRAIGTDRYFDVMTGAAGAILGLLAIDDIPRALACAAHLIAHQQHQPDGGAAWPGRCPRPATGFAHGAAGIAYSLQRLYRRAPDSRLRAAARRAIAYERANFLPVEANWLDVRSLVDPSRPRYGNSWCHGAPGIGLARTGCIDANGVRDIEVALDWIEHNAPPEMDELCCGKWGHIELMLRASQALARPDLADIACHRAAALIGPAMRMAHPGLFSGLSGAGYQLLRLAAPSRLPSVLLWE